MDATTRIVKSVTYSTLIFPSRVHNPGVSFDHFYAFLWKGGGWDGEASRDIKHCSRHAVSLLVVPYRCWGVTTFSDPLCNSASLATIIGHNRENLRDPRGCSSGRREDILKVDPLRYSNVTKRCHQPCHTGCSTGLHAVRYTARSMYASLLHTQVVHNTAGCT